MGYDNAVFAAWVRRLQVFRFCHAIGGHANDADTLLACYAYASEADLLAFFRALNIELMIHHREPPQPQAGKAYAAGEMPRFPSLIKGTRWIQQPGHCRIAEQMVFAWCNAGRIELSVGRGYEITEADVYSAALVEPCLTQFAALRIEPPLDNARCICPKYHPGYFGPANQRAGDKPASRLA